MLATDRNHPILTCCLRRTILDAYVGQIIGRSVQPCARCGGSHRQRSQSKMEVIGGKTDLCKPRRRLPLVVDRCLQIHRSHRRCNSQNFTSSSASTQPLRGGLASSTTLQPPRHNQVWTFSRIPPPNNVIVGKSHLLSQWPEFGGDNCLRRPEDSGLGAQAMTFPSFEFRQPTMGSIGA